MFAFQITGQQGGKQSRVVVPGGGGGSSSTPYLFVVKDVCVSTAIFT